jgi:dihydrodipicolinate synthase/N-acetylneuraminate lyase
MVTPCKAPGVVDPAAMSRLSDTLSQHGCDGLFVAASTGESLLLDEDDRRALTVAARNGAKPETLIYAGVSGMGLKQTIRYAHNAAADGADVAVIMAPFFFKIDQRELAAYFMAIADASQIPVALYHHPRMVTHLDVETVARVASHPNIVALKETSLDASRVQLLIKATKGTHLTVLQGNESLLLESLSLGAHGMVTALAGVVPEWHVNLLAAVRSGDRRAASECYEQIHELWKMFCFEPVGQSITNFAYALRLALRRRGWLHDLHGMLPGQMPNPAFEQLIHEHLIAAQVPSREERGTRIDLPHDLSGVVQEIVPESKDIRSEVDRRSAVA